jgi:hypothetical protein
MADLHGVAHFETGAYRRNATFLEDPEYARALDCLVKGECAGGKAQCAAGGARCALWQPGGAAFVAELAMCPPRRLRRRAAAG